MTPPRNPLHEAAHKVRTPTPADGSREETAVQTAEAPGGVKRSFNEAAHKLGNWPMGPGRPQGAARALRRHPSRRR